MATLTLEFPTRISLLLFLGNYRVVVVQLTEEYIRVLSRLSGDDFQKEVCAFIQSRVLSFQTVPAKPHGDAGLDGFSDGGKIGHCCYGLEHDDSKNNRQREDAIITKFRSDLRRILELTYENKKLVRSTSPEMAFILPKGQKITGIELIVNWFESHRIIGPILTALEEYKLASECQYVDVAANAVILGPRNLADRYAVDEFALRRAGHRTFVRSVQEAAQLVSIGDSGSFETKMETLEALRPDQLPAIKALTATLRRNWRMSIAFDAKLDETVPTLHQTLEECRPRILETVVSLMISTNEPWTKLPESKLAARDILAGAFENRFDELLGDVASGEIARLIGECPVGWKARSND